MAFDTIVLGGGIVGVSVALHLQQRGRAVALVDRKAPGNETSLGNAGLIQREGVYPYAFPREIGTMLRYARNRSLDLRYHRNAMLEIAPFLKRYWHHSAPARHAAIARSYATLIAHSTSEHRQLAEASGAQALIRSGGWTRAFRTEAKLHEAARLAQKWFDEFGVTFDALDATQLHAAEPALDLSLVGGLRYTGSDAVSDPAALVSAYARYFESLGGRCLIGEAETFTAIGSGSGWRVQTQEGPIDAASAVIAMGPWSASVAARLGYDLPLAVKRGYHMHYAPRGDATLRAPVMDAERGYMLAPMARGIRLTTGVELALPEAPKTPTQLEAIEPIARTFFPLGARLDAEPWLGRRPCTPDMMPIIGPAPRQKQLWFAFGHAHHGLTLGPITGRLIADMMTGDTPVVDPTPFRVDRF